MSTNTNNKTLYFSRWERRQAQRSRTPLAGLRAAFMDGLSSLSIGLERRNVRRLIALDALLLILCSLVFGLFCGTCEGGMDLYLGCALPVLLSLLCLAVVTELLGGDRVLTLLAAILIQLGVCLQTLLLLPIDPDSPPSTTSLALFNLLGVLLALCTAPVLTWLVERPCRGKGYRLWALVLLLYAGLRLLPGQNGAYAWISLGGLNIQVTEVLKLLVILAMARVLSSDGDDRERLRAAGFILLVNALGMLLINELGTLFVIGMVFLLMAFLTLKRLRGLMVALALCVLLAGVALVACWLCYKQCAGQEAANGLVSGLAGIYEKISTRFTILTDADAATSDQLYQARQARNALLTSSWFGAKYRVYVPVQESDYILVYLCQNMGILFGILAVLLMMGLCIRAVLAAAQCTVPPMALLGIGFSLTLATQAGLAALSSLGVIPIIGLPFPFLAKGGSATVVHWAMLLLMILSGRKERSHV